MQKKKYSYVQEKSNHEVMVISYSNNVLLDSKCRSE